jgi:hypothetical protein
MTIENYFNPETSCIEINGTGNIFYDGFAFKPTGNYLLMYYKDKEIGRAKLTKTSKTIKNKTEFNKLIKAGLSVFDDDIAPQESVIYDLIDDVEYFISEKLNMEGVNDNITSFKQDLIGNPSNEVALRKLSESMEGLFKIKGVYDDGVGEYYYFNPDKNTFLILDELIYQKLVREEHGLSLPRPSAKKSLEFIICDSEIRRDVWEYHNGYYDPAKKIFISKDSLDEPILTSRQFKYPNGDLVSYTNGVVAFENDKPTLWEETLKQILVPKNNPEDKKLFYDFLAIISSCLEQNNKWKLLSVFFGDGNNGKSIIKLMEELIFDSAYFEPDTEEIKDRFFWSRADDTNLIVMDETDLDTFKKWEALIKRLTSGASGKMDIRKMRSDKNHKSKGFGTFMIFTNDIPEFSQKKAVLNRLFFGHFPNVFTEDVTKDNEYLKNENLWNELEDDYKGIEWFCNILPKAYEEIGKPIQDEEYKKDLMANTSKLGIFLLSSYEPSKNPEVYITNEEIRMAIQYNSDLWRDLTANGGSPSRRIGKAIVRIFGEEIKGRDKLNKAIYYLKERKE